MHLADYSRLDATALADAIRRKETTAAEAQRCAREAAAALNPQLNAIIELFDAPLAHEAQGPFGGVPFLIKDLVLQAEYAERLSDALLALPAGCDNVPTEWYWVNAEMDVPATFDLDRVKTILARCATPELWRTV